MKAIEQAIFTSVETDHQSGYSARPRALGSANAESGELAAWEPSHGFDARDRSGRESFNFIPCRAGPTACRGPRLPAGRRRWAAGAHALPDRPAGGSEPALLRLVDSVCRGLIICLKSTIEPTDAR